MASNIHSTSGHRHPALYAELVDHVLDNLHLDGATGKRDLFQCSLVCKLWADSAARRLFASLQLNPMPLVSSTSGLIPAHFTIRQHPRVTRNVRNLEVTRPNYTSRDRQTAGWNLEGPMKHAIKDEPKLDTLPLVIIADIVATFPQLCSLHFRDIIIGGALPEGISKSAPSLACIAAPIALGELRIDGGNDVHHLLPLRELLDMFVAANTLHFTGNVLTSGPCARDAVLDSNESAPRTKVQHLVLDCSLGALPIDQTCRMLTNAADTAGLQSLSLTPYVIHRGEGRGGDVHVLNMFIRDHASTINTFTLNIDHQHALLDGLRPGDPIRQGLGFNFSCCPNLRIFHLTFWLNYWPADSWIQPAEQFRAQNDFVWEPALRALLTIPPNSLTRLIIGINFAPEGYATDQVEDKHILRRLRALTWKVLTEVMDHHSALETLEIQLPEMLGQSEEVQKSIRKKLPKSFAQMTKFSESCELYYWLE